MELVWSKMTDYQKILDEILIEAKQYLGQGKVANYIPALERVDPSKFSISLVRTSGEEFSAGDFCENFSIQSISKLYVLIMVMQITSSERWKRIGVEPSGSSFNSLVQLESENGIPRNPFINAGAIVLTDFLVEQNIINSRNVKDEIITFVRELSLNKTINISQEVYSSEKETGFRNYSLAYFMKSFENINEGIDEILETYFFHCSLEMTTLDMSRSLLFLANTGINPKTDKRILTESETKRVNALMLTCGTYDGAGKFAFEVGLPAKSGVGGGIVAICPNEFVISVWSPELNQEGNSYLGLKALEMFTDKTGKSIF